MNNDKPIEMFGCNADAHLNENDMALFDAMNVGMKFDGDKVRMDLIDPNFVTGVGQVLTFGAKKYAPNNWQKVDNAEDRYYAAALRHLLAWRAGEKLDPESGLNHLKHVATNIMFLMYFEENK